VRKLVLLLPVRWYTVTMLTADWQLESMHAAQCIMRSSNHRADVYWTDDTACRHSMPHRVGRNLCF